MNEIKIFENGTFGNVRVTTNESGEPQFCLADVCRDLDLHTNVVRQRLEDDICSTYPIVDSLGRSQMATFVNEDGLYDVILDSRKPEARAFRKWLTSEVIPAIRKDGAYVAANGEETEEELMARALMAANAAIKRKEERIKALAEQNSKQAQMLEEQRPAVNFTNAVANADTLILVRDMAKILNQHGYSTGERRFFDVLKRDGYVCRADNMPTQRSMNMGLMRVVENTITTDKMSRIVKTGKITGKGQVYFLNKYCKMSVVEAQNVIAWGNNS